MDLNKGCVHLVGGNWPGYSARVVGARAQRVNVKPYFWLGATVVMLACGKPDAAPKDAAAAPDAQVGADLSAPTDVAVASDATTPDTADGVVACVQACATTDPCATATCNTATGQCQSVPKAEGSGCDDGEPCTVGEHCTGGQCQGGGLDKQCSCLTDSDCAAKDDGKLCNGVQYCNKAVANWTCALNPGSVFACPASSEPCHLGTCLEPGSPGGDPKVAKCAVILADDNSPCEDGKAWTVGDICSGGSCLAGTQTAACGQDADCAKYENGDLCDGTLFCNKAKKLCQINPTTEIYCPTAANTACVKATCIAATGKCAMQAQNELKACDDGNSCIAGDKCSNGQCVAAASTCSCQSNADCAKSEDGDLCNGTLYCDQTLHCAVNPATVVSCPSGFDTVCSQNVCQKATGKCAVVGLPDGITCDADGSPCTPNDTCKSGVCKSDTNVCACQQDADCQDDGNLCNGLPLCDKLQHKCVVNPATVVVCKTVNDTACKKMLCNPLDGQCTPTNVNYLGGCDDGDPSTTTDTCDSGVCAGLPTFACKQDGDCQDDGNPCNGKQVCNKGIGKCVTTAAIGCDGGSDSACAKNTCVAATGKCALQPVNVDGPCEDGAKCTLGDVCDKAGKCVSGQDACCHEASDCADDVVCNGAEYCDKTVFPFACAPPLQKAKDGTACEDGDKCTANDACKAGECLPGGATTCDDANGCTANSCDKAKGCVFVASPAVCSDGDACTEGDICTGTSCGKGVAINCDDANACTSDSCDPAKGCLHANVPSGATCTDSDACTAADACSAGKCMGKAVYPEPVLHSTPNEQGFTGAVLQPSGALVVAENFKAAGKLSTRLVSVTPAGLDPKFVVLLDIQPQAQLWAVVADNDGWAAAGRTTNTAGSDILFVRVNGSGVPVVQAALDLGGEEDGYALAKVGSEFWICGFRSIPDPGTAFVVRVDSQGKCTGNCSTFYKGGPNANNTSFNGLAVLGDGTLLLAGESQTGSNFGAIDAMLFHLTADGQVLWQNAYGGTNDDRFWSARPTAGGNFVGYGAKNYKGWMLGTDASGKQLWEKTFVGTKEFDDLRAAPFGWMAAATTDGGQLLIGTDAVGNLLWQREMLGAPYTLVPLASGYAVVGDLQGDAQVVYADPWGYATCKDAGKCLGVAQCSDSKPCTDDFCDGKAGCVAPVAADGQPCTDDDLCTLDLCAKTGCAHTALAIGAPCGSGLSCQLDKALKCQANDAAPLLQLPGGSFAMGSKAGVGATNETPQHVVTLAPFAIDVHEVTVAQYQAFYAAQDKDKQTAGTNNSAMQHAAPPSDPKNGCNFSAATPQAPITCVDWYQAAAYCAWAGKHLPTEAQWEFAATSAGGGKAYPWGEAAATCALAVMDDPAGGGIGCGGGKPANVCSKTQGNTSQGLCDMAGNVREWTADWFEAYQPGSAVDPVGPPASAQGKVVRGGGWDSAAAAVRAAAREPVAAAAQGNAGLGLRCAQ